MDLSAYPEDISVKFLEQVFGKEFYNFGPSFIEGNAQVIYDLFGALNAFAIVVLVFMLIVTSLSAAIGTAYEGKVLGNYHKFWIPARYTVALGILAPINNGMCILQIILLFFIGTSIEHANILFNTFMNSSYHDLFENPPKFSRENDAYKIASSALSNMTYIQYIRNAYPEDEDIINTETGLWRTGYGSWSSKNVLDMSSNTVTGEEHSFIFYNPRNDGSWFPNGYNSLMGKISFVCTRDETYEGCMKQKVAIDKAIGNLAEIAFAVERAGVGAERIDNAELDKRYNSIVNVLDKELQQATLDAYKVKLQEMKNEYSLEDFEKRGWAVAGSLYHQISGLTARILDVLQLSVSVSNGDHWTNENFAINDRAFEFLSNYYQNISESINKNIEANTDGNDLQKLLNDSFKGTDGLLKWAFQMLYDEGNALGTFAAVGQIMIGAVLSAFGILLLMGAKASAFSFGLADGLITVTGLTFVAILTPIFVGGVILAYYIPMIPFIIWTSALVGWFIVVIESLVAAPLWIIGMANSEQEGFLGENGRQGLFLFMDVLIRPFAMLFGLAIAITVIDNIALLFMNLFGMYSESFDAQVYQIPIVSQLIYFALFSILFTSFVHKVFGLIHYLPDVIMHWMGASGHAMRQEVDESTVGPTIRHTAGHLAFSTNNMQKNIADELNKKNVNKDNRTGNESNKDSHTNRS